MRGEVWKFLKKERAEPVPEDIWNKARRTFWKVLRRFHPALVSVCGSQPNGSQQAATWGGHKKAKTQKRDETAKAHLEPKENLETVHRTHTRSRKDRGEHQVVHPRGGGT